MSLGDRELAPEREGQEAGEEAATPTSGPFGDLRRVAAAHRRRVQRKANGNAGKANIPQGGGAPLGGEVRGRMESQLGADLSGVRVHTGGDSAKAAGDLGARAFTVDNDVHFNAGEFAPGTREGDRLLAHELTHVVQGARGGVQRKASPGHEDDLEVSEPHDPAEHEADSVADHVAGNLHEKGAKEGGGGKAPTIGAGGGKLARKIYREPIPGAGNAAPAAANGGGGPPNAAPGAEQQQKSPEETQAEQTIEGEKSVIETCKAPSNVALAETILANETRAGEWAAKFPQNQSVKSFIELLRAKQLEVFQECSKQMQEMGAQIDGVDEKKPEGAGKLEQIKGSTLLQQWRDNPLVGIGKKYENNQIKDVGEKIEKKTQAMAAEQEKQKQQQEQQAAQQAQGGANGGGPPGANGGGAPGANAPGSANAAPGAAAPGAAPAAANAAPPAPAPAAPAPAPAPAANAAPPSAAPANDNAAPAAAPAPAANAAPPGAAPASGAPANENAAPAANGPAPANAAPAANGPAPANAAPAANGPAPANAAPAANGPAPANAAPGAANAAQGQQAPGAGNLTPDQKQIEEEKLKLVKVQLERSMQSALMPFILADKLLGGCASAVAVAGVVTGHPEVAAVGGMVALGIGAVTTGATFYREFQASLAQKQLDAMPPDQIQALIDKWNVDPGPDFSDKLKDVQKSYEAIQAQLTADKRKAAEPSFLQRIGLTLKSIFKSKGGDQVDAASTALEGAEQGLEVAAHVIEPIEKVAEGFAHVVPFISLAAHIGTGIAELLNYKHLRDEEEELKQKLGIPPAGQAANPAAAQGAAPGA